MARVEGMPCVRDEKVAAICCCLPVCPMPMECLLCYVLWYYLRLPNKHHLERPPMKGRTPFPFHEHLEYASEHIVASEMRIVISDTLADSTTGGIKSSFLACSGYGEAEAAHAATSSGSEWDPACVVCADLLTSYDGLGERSAAEASEGHKAAGSNEAHVERDERRVDYMVVVTACNEVLLIEARPSESVGGRLSAGRKVRLLTQGHSVRLMVHNEWSMSSLVESEPVDPNRISDQLAAPSPSSLHRRASGGVQGHEQHTAMLRCCAVSPHPSIPHLFVTGGLDGTVRVWDCSTVSMVAMYLAQRLGGRVPGPRLQHRERSTAAPQAAKDVDAVTAVAWSGKDRLEHHVAVGTRSGDVHVVVFTQGRRLLRLLQALSPRAARQQPRASTAPGGREPGGGPAAHDGVVALKYRRDGSILAGGTADGHVYVWYLFGPSNYVLGDAKALADLGEEKSGKAADRDDGDSLAGTAGAGHDAMARGTLEHGGSSHFSAAPTSPRSEGRLAAVHVCGHSILSLDWAVYAQSGAEVPFLRATTHGNHVQVWQVQVGSDSGDGLDSADEESSRRVVLEEVTAGSAWAKRVGDLRWETWTSPVGWTVAGFGPSPLGRAGAEAGSKGRGVGGMDGKGTAGGAGGAARAGGGGGMAHRGRAVDRERGSTGSAAVLVECHGTGRRDSLWTRDVAVAADSDGTIRLARAPVLAGARAWEAPLMPEVQWRGPFGGQAGLCFSCDGRRIFAVVGGAVRVLALLPHRELGHADPRVRAQRRAALVVSDADREVRPPRPAAPTAALATPCRSRALPLVKRAGQ